MDCISVSDLNKTKEEELDKLFDEYSMALQLINLFIEVNSLDYDEVWDKANRRYDEDMTYAPSDDN